LADGPAYALDPAALRERRAADERFPYNSGRLLADALQRLGTDHLFTLSGGHLFPLFDGCVANGMRVIDHRHEEAAVHAAEAWAKLTRTPGVAAVTAGPGVTNATTGLAAATFNRSPMMVIGGRAPDFRWGQGSLQEYEQVPVMATVAKKAVTVHEGDRVHIAAHDLWYESLAGAPGATFMDVPMDVLLTTLDAAQVEWPQAPEALAGAFALIEERLADGRPLLAEAADEEVVRERGEIADRPDAVLAKGGSRLRADAPQPGDRERGEELGLGPGLDDDQAVGLAEVRGDLRDELRRRDAYGDRQGDLRPDGVSGSGDLPCGSRSRSHRSHGRAGGRKDPAGIDGGSAGKRFRRALGPFGASAGRSPAASS